MTDLVVDEELEAGGGLRLERGAVELELVPERHLRVVTLDVGTSAGHSCKE